MSDIDKFRLIKLEARNEELLKLRQDFQRMREHYAKIHASEGSYVTYDDGVTHGMWTAYMMAEKQIDRILTQD